MGSTALQLQRGDGQQGSGGSRGIVKLHAAIGRHTQTHTSSSVNQTPVDPMDPRLIPRPVLGVASLHVPAIRDVGEGRCSLFI